jgi:hypothetical protein
MAETKRTGVQIDAPTYERAKEYSAATGVPIARVVDRSINEYLDKHGREHMKTLAAKKGQ